MPGAHSLWGGVLSYLLCLTLLSVYRVGAVVFLLLVFGRFSVRCRYVGGFLWCLGFFFRGEVAPVQEGVRGVPSVCALLGDAPCDILPGHIEVFFLIGVDYLEDDSIEFRYSVIKCTRSLPLDVPGVAGRVLRRSRPCVNGT